MNSVMKNYSSVFKELWVLNWDHYRKGYINLILGWFVTAATLWAWLQFKDIRITDGSKISYDPFVVASGIGISVIRNCLFNFYRTLFFFRTKGFLDKVFLTPVSKRFVFFTLIFFNQVMNIFVTLFLFGLAMFFPDERHRISQINWSLVISSFVLLIIMCNLIAFVLIFATKSFEKPLVIVNIIYFIAIYMLGLGIPLGLVLNENSGAVGFSKFIYYIGYIFPVKYPINIMQAGWSGSTTMAFTASSKQQFWTNDAFGYGHQLWLPYISSLGWISVFGIYVGIHLVKTYEIGDRKYNHLVIRKQRLKAINAIKKCQNIEQLEQLVKQHKLIVKETTVKNSINNFISGKPFKKRRANEDRKNHD